MLILGTNEILRVTVAVCTLLSAHDLHGCNEVYQSRNPKDGSHGKYTLLSALDLHGCNEVFESRNPKDKNDGKYILLSARDLHGCNEAFEP